MDKSTRDRQRFWANVNKTDTCWLWKKPGTDGYGRFYMQGDFHQAHRVSYGWEYGEVPVHLVVDHLCRVHGCVRPSHLEAVTQAENLRRAIRKPRSQARAVEPAADKPKHKTGSRPRYCRVCLTPAAQCEDIRDRVCAPCREQTRIDALAVLENRMSPLR